MSYAGKKMKIITFNRNLLARGEVVQGRWFLWHFRRSFGRKLSHFGTIFLPTKLFHRG